MIVFSLLLRTLTTPSNDDLKKLVIQVQARPERGTWVYCNLSSLYVYGVSPSTFDKDNPSLDVVNQIHL